MGKYVDYYMRDEGRPIKKIVDNIIKKNFGWITQKDYDDFYSIAGQTVWYCEEHYEESKNKNFDAYLTNSLQRKIKTQITRMNRKKRNNGMTNLSIEALIDEENDLKLGDLLVAKEVPEISSVAQRYIDSLSYMQREVATLIMQGYSPGDIMKRLNMSQKRFDMVYERMKSSEKTRVLNYLKGVKQ